MFATPASGWVTKVQPVYTLTVTERAELLNWACFDTLPVVMPESLLTTPRYVNSPEFQSEDIDPMYARMRRVLEEIPAGDPVAIDHDERLGLHKLLEETWFSVKLTEHMAHLVTGQARCFLRARYLFVTHWLTYYPQVTRMESLIHRASDAGLNKRFTLQAIHFDGTRGDELDVHQSE